MKKDAKRVEAKVRLRSERVRMLSAAQLDEVAGGCGCDSCDMGTSQHQTTRRFTMTR